MTLANQLLENVLLAEGRMIAFSAVEFTIAVAVLIGLSIGLWAFSRGVLLVGALFAAVNSAGTFTYLFLLRDHRPPYRSPDLQRCRGRMLALTGAGST